MHTDVIGGGYTKRELELRLRYSRQCKRMPRRTLDRWMKALCMIPDEDGLYTESDLEILQALANWTDRGLRIEKFVKKVHNNAN